MTDENIRRLLFYSKQERVSSRQVTGRRPEKFPRHFAILKQQDSAIEEFLTTTLSGLSVEPLWIEDYGKIRDELRALEE